MKHEGGARIGRDGGIASGFMGRPEPVVVGSAPMGATSPIGMREASCPARCRDNGALARMPWPNGRRWDERRGQWPFPGVEAGPYGRWGGKGILHVTARDSHC
jgi:hypothetical protein